MKDESQQHLLECSVIINNCPDLFNDVSVKYEDLFSPHPEIQLRATILLQSALETRERNCIPSNRMSRPYVHCFSPLEGESWVLEHSSLPVSEYKRLILKRIEYALSNCLRPVRHRPEVETRFQTLDIY